MELVLEMENIVSIVARGDLVEVDGFLTHSQSAAVLHVVDKACSEFSTEVHVSLLKICIKWWKGDRLVDMKRRVSELEQEAVRKESVLSLQTLLTDARERLKKGKIGGNFIKKIC